ncbi:MAG: hypothetical protein C0434_03610 [Xanthomonadaceae bacterium]|nr:hypothetical protein [Xanthomonadaceae bacterium]
MKPLTRRLIPAVIATTMFSALASPVANADELAPYYLAPMGSYVLADDGRGTKNGIGGTLALGAHLGALIDFELRGSFINFGSKDGSGSSKLGAGGFGVNVYLFRAPGGSGLYIHGDVQGSEKVLYHYGAGYELMFGGFGLRAEGLIRNEQFEHHEPMINVGLRIPFGSNPPKPVFVPPPPPPPKEEAVVAPPPPPPPPPPCNGADAGTALSLDGCKKGDNIVLRGVNFEFDKDVLTVNATVILNEVASALARRPDIKVEIGGHTDAKGSVSYNKKLSDRRAASVRSYLMQKGVAQDRITSVGYGKIVAIASNDTDEGRALNRRVELTVTDADPAAGGVVSEQAGKADEVVTPPVEDTMPPAEAGAMELEAPVAPAVAAAATAAVSIIDYEYSPKVTTVKAGGTVTWTNNDRVTHTVTFDGTDIKVKSAETYSRAYPAAGTFEYKCGIHPTMFGTVVVVP